MCTKAAVRITSSFPHMEPVENAHPPGAKASAHVPAALSELMSRSGPGKVLKSS